MNRERKNSQRNGRNSRAGRQLSRRNVSDECYLRGESQRTHSPGSSRSQGCVQRVNGGGQPGMPAGRGYQHKLPTSSSRSSTSSSRSSQVSGSISSKSAHQQDSQVTDIPGYYYDKETKLYFKIQSYTMGMVTPFITKDKIISQQKESQRVQDIKNFTNRNLSSSPSATATTRPGLSALRPNNHIVNVLKDMQCGQFTCQNLKTYIVRHACSRIQPDAKWDNSLPFQPSVLLGDIQLMEVSKRRDKMACVTSLKSSYSHVIQLMTVDEQPPTSKVKHSVLRVNIPHLAQGPIHKRIKTLCWAPLQGRGGQETVLYTTVCPIGCLESIVYLSNLKTEGDQQSTLFELNLGKRMIWSSAWNKHEQKFIVGTERRCCLIDVTTRKQWIFGTCDSDPLSQLFSPSDPYIYNGTRKGHILFHDVRAPGKGSYTLMMTQAPGIGCLRLLRDQNYLMASDFSGMICTWDQRMRRKVMEYKGLVNSHWQLPFHLDETESLLTSTGSDSYTKIWDMRTGDILRSIPPQYSVSSDSFPLSFYSTCWGNRDGNSGLLVAMRNSFRFFTYREALD